MLFRSLVKATAKQVEDALGYPPEEKPEGQVSGVKITLDKPGQIVWGINDRSLRPPKEFYPAGSSDYPLNLVQTRLTGPNAEGKYEVAFPAFDPTKQNIRAIAYQTLGPRGGLGPLQRVTRFHPKEKATFLTKFGEASPLIVEAHTGGDSGAHGLSLVTPIPTDPTRWKRVAKRYAALAWAKDTPWGGLFVQIGKELMPAEYR